MKTVTTKKRTVAKKPAAGSRKPAAAPKRPAARTAHSAKALIAPSDVHATLARHMLADGYDLVLDLEKSKGRRLHDAKSGRWYLDMFSFFATAPLGLNHPKMREPRFLEQLMHAAITNPANSDIYTVEMAEFVATFGRVAMPSHLHHVFFIAGGTLGVENALKAAF